MTACRYISGDGLWIDLRWNATATSAPSLMLTPYFDFIKSIFSFRAYNFGCLATHGCASSNAAAARRTVASAKRRPTICSPTGRPS